MKNQMILRGASLMALAVLTACGGGGSDSSVKTPDPVVSSCANGAKDYPTCTPPYVAADLQLTVQKPPYPDGSEDMRAFDYLNDVRSSLGLGKLNYSAELTKASANHLNYITINKVVTHDESASLAGFTGVRPIDRAQYAGYPLTSVSEVIALGNTKTGAIERLLGSVYHRSTLLDEGMRDVGSSGIVLDGGTSVVLNLGDKGSKQRNASDFVMVYPKDGQTNVNLSMCGESPWPFPDIKVDQACTNPRLVDGKIVYDMKVGYPVSIAIQANNELTVSSFKMFEAGNNTAIDVWLNTKATDATKLIAKHEAYITAKAGLKPNTKYEVTFSGTSNGKAFTRNWSFVTAANLH